MSRKFVKVLGLSNRTTIQVDNLGHKTFSTRSARVSLPNNTHRYIMIKVWFFTVWIITTLNGGR